LRQEGGAWREELEEGAQEQGAWKAVLGWEKPRKAGAWEGGAWEEVA